MGIVNTFAKSVIDRISKYLDNAFPLFFFLLAVSFYLRTYDSAQVKITEVQMFGIILIALWFCKVFESGHWPFDKKQTVTVLPFILIFASGIISFIRSPLHWGSFDFFVRRVIYIGLAFITMTEYTSLKDFRRMTNWLIIAVTVVTLYGLIQYIDFYFFPPGPPTVGIDVFVWRRAFGQRIFSTFGNPNFYSNFLVILVPIMMAACVKYWINHQRHMLFFLVPLIILTICNVIWTGSKGPAMGLAAGSAVFGFLIIRFFVQSRKIKVAVFSTSGVIVAILLSYIYVRVFVQAGQTSFTFRMYTWLSTWEMINARPILGNGIGTFWVIYPAYRRPAIFHIEAKHNTETDHAENEHLEFWMDEGLVGIGLWFWMIIMISIGIYKIMASLTASQPTRAGPQKTEQRYPEEVYYALGFVSGFLGMLIHNNTDVSMRFVSSGAPFWMLAGLNAALIMHSPIPENQPPHVGNKNQIDEPPVLSPSVMKILRYVVIAVTSIIAIRILREFDWCQGRDGWRNPNELPHCVITWGFFLICWGAATWWFIQLAKHCTRIKSLVTILIAVILMVPFWGIFIGDVDHNRAIFFSKQGIWTRSPEYDSRITGFPAEYQQMYWGGAPGTIEKNSALGKFVNFVYPDYFWRRYGIGGALEHYVEVNRLRPDFIMAHYFRGNVYNDWGSQFAQKTQEAFSRGDIAQAEVYRKETDDLWTKAMDAYTSTRKLGPNYVQMHHQVGTVYQKWGDFFNSLAPLAEKYGHKDLADEYHKLARDYWLKALQSYKLYYMIDPVYDQNFYRMAQIYIQLGDLDSAEREYIDNIDGSECKKPYHQIFGGFNYWKMKGFGTPDNRYDLASPEHTHDIVNPHRPEAWIYLADFYAFIRNNPQKAEAAYKRAIEIEPLNVDFLKRLVNFYQRTGRGHDAIDVWKRIYQLNPSDPDVQRVIQASQPQKKKT